MSVDVLIAKFDQAIRDLVGVALAKDARARSHFDAVGFFQFFPEQAKGNPWLVQRAWQAYDELIRGQYPHDRAYRGRRHLKPIVLA
jgi:hypothetical protein